TSSTITTQKPIIRIFTCDFTDTLCFEDSELVITNGTQFMAYDLTLPPQAPLSDVSSISEPTTNNETCKLPYQPMIDNGTNTASSESWFCYDNQCPTQNQQKANCTIGDYGLVAIDASESSKTINQSIGLNVTMDDLVDEQCLRYYYYFTVYEEVSWGQQVSVLIKFENGTGNEIDRLSDVDMIENRWYSRNITFNSTSTNYTLIFRFEVTAVNRTEHPALNKTIYFALDNIDIYDRNCRDVLEPPSSPMTTELPRPPEPPGIKPMNLGLILGLSLGLGIPALAAIIFGSTFYAKKLNPRVK
ncbi:unnamed protein product, partial [Rotaria magnacalcarata]